MTVAADPAFDDALLAARLCAIDPAGLGGMILRGGEARDCVIAALRAALPVDAPLRRIPAQVDDTALLGGLDLGATLALGRPVRQAGVLAAADGGMIVLPMAERIGEGTAARIAGVLDTGRVEDAPARFAVVALDDGVDEEAPPQSLIERLAFRIDLSQVRAVPAADSPMRGGAEQDAAPIDPFDTLAKAALALGVHSARGEIFALRAAWASARLAGREHIVAEDVIRAIRLVLAPRATRLPAPPEAEDEAETPPPPPETDSSESESADQDSPTQPLDDVVLAAALAALPRDVLEKLAAGGGRRQARGARGKGERRRSMQRGRPMGARAGVPRGGLRLSLIDTLRAAAPWQRLRARGAPSRILIRRDDLRIHRFEMRAGTLTIFAVDASGSAAAARLAEAKGAVELLLAEAYVKRAEVALIAFRGTTAETLLPPTRSLTRARRALAELPGGGGTPLAAGLSAALAMAELTRGRGRTPFIVVLTDGRANIAADGTPVRERAEQDAEHAARAIGQSGIGAAFVDISARPRPEGARLALAMGARYLPLPRADAAAMHRAVAAVQAA